MADSRTLAYLGDMLRFVQELRAMLAGLSEAEFVGNRLLTLATEKLFINLGEAAHRVGAVRREQIKDIPWRAIIGLRNVMAHGYEEVEHATLYAAVQRDLPVLEETLKTLLDQG